MAKVKFVLDPAAPPRLSRASVACLDAMTDAEITAAAESDADNPPLTEIELDRLGAARIAKAAHRLIGSRSRGCAIWNRVGLGRRTAPWWPISRSFEATPKWSNARSLVEWSPGLPDSSR